MTPSTNLDQNLRERTSERANALRQEQEQKLWTHTDRLFAGLLVMQWIAGIVIALCISPRAWEGLDSHIHPHVWAAVFLGGIIASGPVALAIWQPGQTLTRMVISVAQALHSGLLIHLSGGRIETHFHVFGSLAFLSFYRDWRVLVPATLVIALDHVLRGLFWPESVFGVAGASSWRWLEHAGWVIFEDIFLIWSCVRGAKEMKTLAQRQAELETTNERVEAEVARQTARLELVSQELVGTARRAGMAEIATGVLHNVGNVLNSINVSANVVSETLRKSEVTNLARAGEMLRSNQENLAEFLTKDERGKFLPPYLIEVAQCLGQEQENLLAEMNTVDKGLEHIKQIVSAQQQHAKHGVLREKVLPAELFEQAIAMDPVAYRASEVQIVREFERIPMVPLDKHKILQILINLLTNAKKALASTASTQKRIVLSISKSGSNTEERLTFAVADNGVGIAPENLLKVFSHGFTTREEGHGFGLHSASNAAREMGGELRVSSEGIGKGTKFTLEVPIAGMSAAEEMMIHRKGARHAVQST